MGVDNRYYSLGYLDNLSYGDTFVHRLDPRAKILATGLFVVIVVSCGKYEINGLLPLFFYPMLLAITGEIPLRYIGRKLLYLSPFPLLIGIFNPVLDREPMAVIMGIELCGGWISFASIMLKFALTTSAALLLIATTSFPLICVGFERLAFPKLFVAQMMFIYRYIFMLIAESMRMIRARQQRRFDAGRITMSEFSRLTGVFFIRTYERADRVYTAMLSRGFDGSIKTLRDLSFGLADTVFIIAVSAAMILLRWFDLSRHIGGLFIQ